MLEFEIAAYVNSPFELLLDAKNIPTNSGSVYEYLWIIGWLVLYVTPISPTVSFPGADPLRVSKRKADLGEGFLEVCHRDIEGIISS
jgi:hypothetical protein